MSIPIDTFEVLQQLNKYGITSIEYEAFKFFIRDLKKLIKYERKKNHPDKISETSIIVQGSNNSNSSPKSPKTVLSDEKPVCACKLNKNTTDVANNAVPKNKTTGSINLSDSARSNKISRRCGGGKKLRCDPVDLYQYYQSIWKHHKLLGENYNTQFRLGNGNR